MAVQLKKGQGIKLKKEAPNLRRILVGLGWDPVKKGFFKKLSDTDMDIDGSVICIDKDGKWIKTVYFGELKAFGGAIEHKGDNLTGEGDGDDEQIEIVLDKLPDKVNRLAIIINIYSAYFKKQDFSQVKNCFVHVDDMDTAKELVRYDIDGNFDEKTGIFVADIYRYDGEWKFKAIGEGVRVKNIGEMVSIKCK